MTTMFRKILHSTRLCLISVLLLATPLTLLAEQETVELKGQDGFSLTATLWQSAPEGPGIVLLHQCNHDRTMYNELGPKLAAAGFRVLAPDFRGLGDSTSDEFDLEAGSPEDWERAKEHFGGDVEAAYEYLGNVVGTLGASCGGGEAIRLAAAHPDIKSVGLLSSRLSPLEERDAMKLVAQKLLIVVAKGDGGAARPAGTLLYRRRSAVTLELYDGDAHGYPLFEQQPELYDLIVNWFEETAEG